MGITKKNATKQKPPTKVELIAEVAKLKRSLEASKRLASSNRRRIFVFERNLRESQRLLAEEVEKRNAERCSYSKAHADKEAFRQELIVLKADLRKRVDAESLNRSMAAGLRDAMQETALLKDSIKAAAMLVQDVIRKIDQNPARPRTTDAEYEKEIDELLSQ